MKKVAFIVFAICLFSMVVFAHQGKTDSSGGHYDHESGGYHYHHGYPAHQHTNGICPYDFDDKTNHNSSSSKSSTKSENENKVTKATDSTKRNDTGMKICIGFLSFFNSLFICGAISLAFTKGERIGGLFYGVPAAFFFVLLWKQYDRITIITTLITVSLYLSVYVISSLSDKVDKYIEAYEITVIEYEDFLSRKETLTTAPTIPQQYEIGDDNLPKEKGTEDWGKSLTFYKSLSGKKLHQKYNCGNATTKVHLFQYRNYRNLKEMLCKNCSVQNLPEMRWYNDFLKYQEALKGFDEISAKSENTYNTMLDCRKKCNSIWFAFLLLFSKKKRATRNELNARCDTIKEEHSACKSCYK